MEPEAEIKEYLRGGGSATRKRLIEEADSDSVDVARALGELILSGEVEEYPGIRGAYRLTGDE